MKKVTTRAYAALVIAACVVLGLAFYLFKLVRDGGEWASFYANDSVYDNGTLNEGQILDRNGVVLASAGDGTYSYADDSDVRIACLHVVGDIAGNIGTGALSAFRTRLIDYSFLTGTTGSGGTVKLTIDSALNVTAYKALAGRKGAVLVYNYKTGEILCMVSSPSYDPEVGFDENDSSYDGVYINRAISATFVPGSIFKIVTVAAAAETRSDLWNDTFDCDGSVEIDGDTITCSGVHGSQTIEEAFAHSCNCAFAEIADEVGGDVIASYAEKYGLTETHSLNGIETAAGSIVSGGTSDADTAWEGIGQYEDMVCPYSMLRLVGAIANDGTLVEPTLLYGESNGTTQLMEASTAETLEDMMSYNTQYEYGADNFPGLDICAKTGTAQVGDGTDHAWFVGYITNEDYPLAFVVLVENGGGGLSQAGAVANTVLQQAVFGS